MGVVLWVVTWCGGLLRIFEVVVLDNLSNGVRENIADVEGRVKLIVGDVRNAETVREALRGAGMFFIWLRR